MLSQKVAVQSHRHRWSERRHVDSMTVSHALLMTTIPYNLITVAFLPGVYFLDQGPSRCEETTDRQLTSAADCAILIHSLVALA